MQALHLFESGMKQSRVARLLDISRTTASRWQHTIASKGPEALKLRRPPGRPCRLTEQQLRELAATYRRTAEVRGWKYWTSDLVRDVIHQKFGVLYDSDHVSRMIRKLNLRAKRHYAERVSVDVQKEARA